MNRAVQLGLPFLRRFFVKPLNIFVEFFVMYTNILSNVTLWKGKTSKVCP